MVVLNEEAKRASLNEVLVRARKMKFSFPILQNPTNIELRVKEVINIKVGNIVFSGTLEKLNTDHIKPPEADEKEVYQTVEISVESIGMVDEHMNIVNSIIIPDKKTFLTDDVELFY